jgi:antiviral helicase SLH1
MDPLPKVRDIEIERIRVMDCFSPKYAKCFESEFLNTAQSYVFDHAYNTSDNMLVCAPTGAGKTNIATLTMLQAIKQVKNEEDVKIVYISPMKALAN